MKRLLIIISTLVLTFSVSAAQFSKAETSEIQKVEHSYLIKHPEILVQMSQELQQKQYQQVQDKALAAIKANSKELFTPQGSQVMGNQKGTVTLVEFFDYQCVHCSNLHKQKTIANLVKANSNLRVVTQEFPIFGPQSVYASKAAMAVADQGKYHQMRDAIFNTGEIEGKLKDVDIDKAATSIDLNMSEYRKDMKRYGNGRYKDNIAKVHKLAHALGIHGTPSFVIAPTPKLGNSSGKTTFIPGLVSAEQMQQAITAAK